MNPEPPDWYHEGLPFSCTGCGDCCTGEPGAVWLNDEDVALLAGHLGLTAAEFARRHVRMLAGRRALIERFNGDCEFFDPQTRGCRAYPARPAQCRTYPFWPQHLQSEQQWRERVCTACEGARAPGPIIGVEQIRALARQAAQARERR